MTTSPLNTSVDSNATDETPARRSIINGLSLLSLSLASALLTASVVLIHQYKLGIPFSLITSLIIATAVGLLAPLLLTWLFSRFKPHIRNVRFYTFIIVNLVLSTVIGLLIF